jgi:purine-binding chemotaxis protein CheW
MSDNSNQNQIAATPAQQYLIVKLAGHEYGVRLDHLQEVLRYDPFAVAPVPNTLEWLEGIFSLRGTIISVVNLRVFLGLPRYSAAEGGSSEFDFGFGFGRPVQRLIVTFSGDLIIGFLVDDIRGVAFVTPELVNKSGIAALAAPDSLKDYLEGVYTDPESGRTTTLLEIRRIVKSPQLLIFEPIEAV